MFGMLRGRAGGDGKDEGESEGGGEDEGAGGRSRGD
jgi:hypothetical protein